MSKLVVLVEQMKSLEVLSRWVQSLLEMSMQEESLVVLLRQLEIELLPEAFRSSDSDEKKFPTSMFGVATASTSVSDSLCFQ